MPSSSSRTTWNAPSPGSTEQRHLQRTARWRVRASPSSLLTRRHQGESRGRVSEEKGNAIFCVTGEGTRSTGEQEQHLPQTVKAGCGGKLSVSRHAQDDSLARDFLISNPRRAVWRGGTPHSCMTRTPPACTPCPPHTSLSPPLSLRVFTLSGGPNQPSLTSLDPLRDVSAPELLPSECSHRGRMGPCV